MKNSEMPAMPLYADPDDWTLRWCRDIGSAKKGDIAGSDVCRGYRQIKYKGKRYLAHRVIFYFANGFLPEEVDHIDGDTKNNSPSNLRASTRKTNARNRKDNKNNSSGHKGVDWMPRQKQWRAQIGHEGKIVYLGIRKSLKLAIQLRKDAEEKYHGEYSRK
jgi:hypothetical protein